MKCHPEKTRIKGCQDPQKHVLARRTVWQFKKIRQPLAFLLAPVFQWLRIVTPTHAPKHRDGQNIDDRMPQPFVSPCPSFAPCLSTSPHSIPIAPLLSWTSTPPELNASPPLRSPCCAAHGTPMAHSNSRLPPLQRQIRSVAENFQKIPPKLICSTGLPGFR